MQYTNLFRVGGPLSASGFGTANVYGRSIEATAIGPSPSQMQTVAAADYRPRGRPGKRGRLRPLDQTRRLAGAFQHRMPQVTIRIHFLASVDD